MRAHSIGLAVAAMATGCLRDTEFKCQEDSECGTGGVCESVGYCSIADAKCAGTGRIFSDSAGQGLSSTCVPAESAGCPSDYVAIADSRHRYKRLSNLTWDQARAMCAQAGTAGYLLIPDDATELKNLAAVTSPPFWIGLDDRADPGMFLTQKNMLATFLPWGTGEPDNRLGRDCVRAISSTQIATDACTMKHSAVCECEP